eukprot:37677-Eustigmatos_ZCMA.PRE.1
MQPPTEAASISIRHHMTQESEGSQVTRHRFRTPWPNTTQFPARHREGRIKSSGITLMSSR